MRPDRRSAVAPSQQARWLADEMVEMDSVMRSILEETIPDGRGGKVHESGRTVCGQLSDVRGPLARFPSSVELASCPRGVNGGTWHSHVTKDELREPHNSLPDTANVIFGNIDVSAVVGTRSVEVVMAAENSDRAISEFQDAIGAGVTSTDDVIDAIISGDVPDPTDARSRVRRRLGPLFNRRQVSFPDLDKKLSMSGIPASSPLSAEMHEAQHYSMIISESTTASAHSKNPRDPDSVREFCRDGNATIKRVAEQSNAAQIAKNVALTSIVRRAIDPILP